MAKLTIEDAQNKWCPQFMAKGTFQKCSTTECMAFEFYGCLMDAAGEGKMLELYECTL